MKKYRVILFVLLLVVMGLCGCSKEQKKVDDDSLKNKNLEEFNDKAVQEMLKVQAVGEDAYYQQFQSEDAFEEKQNCEGITADKSYQVRIQDADRYADACDKLIDVYIRSYKDISEQQKYDANADYFQTNVEITSSTLLAGDRNDFVIQVNFRQYVADEEKEWYEKEHSTWGEVVTTKDGTYLYGSWVLHAKMVKDYVFEMVGVADSNETLTAFKEKYPEYQSLYESIPIPNPVALEKCRAKVEDSKLKITYDNGTSWKEVPISTELLFARGDERDGALSELQAGSYYVSKEFTVFLYGGSSTVPFSAIISTDGGKEFHKTLISHAEDIRAEYISVPDGSDKIFVLAAGGRAMSQEGNTLYVSEDNGESFAQINGIEEQIHFLTTDFTFLTETNGFICIQDSQSPHMLVTNDGGTTWEDAEFLDVPEYYSMAYAPKIEGDHYELYVGEEGYAKNQGKEYLFISEDEGKTWKKH